jgi:hypothetical protein
LRLICFARLFFFARQDAKPQRGFLCGSSALRELFLFFFASLRLCATYFFYADLGGKMTLIDWVEGPP